MYIIIHLISSLVYHFRTCMYIFDLIDIRSQGLGGRSSGNSGSDNENPIINMSNAVAGPQEYMSHSKVLNSSENLHLGQGSELKYGEKLPYGMYQGKKETLSVFKYCTIYFVLARMYCIHFIHNTHNYLTNCQLSQMFTYDVQY